MSQLVTQVAYAYLSMQLKEMKQKNYSVVTCKNKSGAWVGVASTTTYEILETRAVGVASTIW